MPPKEPACTQAEGGPCAVTTNQCSHLVAPAFANNEQIVIARTDPGSPCDAWYYNEIPGEQLSPCYLPAETSGYIPETGGVFLSECKFRVLASSAELWHEKPGSKEFERTSGPGWAKVGIELVCGYGCSEYSTEDEVWMAIQAPPVSEEAKKEPITHPPPELSLSYKTTPERVLVGQNDKGPEPQTVKFTVTAKNVGKTPALDVTFQDPPKITPIGHLPHATDVSGCAWAQGTPFGAPLTSVTKGAAPVSPPCPLAETAGPGSASKPGAPAPLDVGTLEPGASASATYTMTVDGDGDYTVYSTVSASREVENSQGEVYLSPVNVIGAYHFHPETQLLMFSATLGAKVKSQEFPALIKAGTHFLIDVHLENRSNYQQLQVDRIEPELNGNATDGELVPASTSTAIAPSGSLSQVSISPTLKLEPGEKRNYEVIVGTTASDPFAAQGAHGGTRATVKFEPPTIATVNEEKPTAAQPDQVVMEPGSTEFNVGVDDSAPAPPPFNLEEAEFAVAKGAVFGLWNATYGLVHGIYDLANLGAKGVYNVSTGTLVGLNHLVELWTATAGEPGAHAALVQAVLGKVEESFYETPYLIDESREKLEKTVSAAIDAYFTKIANAWIAGDWREALQDVAETGTNAGATLVGPAALKVAAGSLSRLEPVAAAWKASAAAAFDRVGSSLDAVASSIEEAKAAIAELAKVLPGYEYTVAELSRYFGVDAKEADWISEFTKSNKISLVFRSRAEESLAWLEKGGMLKPYWVKAKTVSWVDVEFLGYKAKDVGRVIMREPPSLNVLKDELKVKSIAEGTPEYQTVYERWETRTKNYAKEIKEMEGWNKKKNIKGKWPWQENGVDPNVQADEYLNYKFRLTNDPGNPGSRIPEIFNPKTKKWGSITGDIDLIALTKADGSALSDAEHVKILKELSKGPLGTQHPESLTWEKDGKFWFKAKEGYLKDEALVQSGPDGKFRSVQFNEALSDPSAWTKLDYRIYWNGGFGSGPGQVTTPPAFG